MSNQDPHTLIIWEEVPETTTLFLVPDQFLAENPEIQRIVRSSHREYGNSTDPHDHALVLNYLVGEPEYGPTSQDVADLVVWEDGWAGILRQFILPEEQTSVPPVTTIITSGFFL